MPVSYENTCAPSRTPHIFRPLRVVGRGICCAVGHTARAATAAMNARMNHFRETEFVGNEGHPIIGGALYDVPAWGVERLALMLTRVVQECLTTAPQVSGEHIALFLLTSEAERPGLPRRQLAFMLDAQLDSRPLHPASKLCEYGKGGIARALEEASELLSGSSAPRYVLLVALDSLLDAAAIEAFLAEERIATETNPDGFIPAEGAAALLLSQEESPAPALWIESVATATEPWRTGGDTPLRATGLSQAMREASRLAGAQIAELDFHASGMTGESWYAKEVSLALSRCLERKKRDFAHYMVAQHTGETGAASPVLTLAWLADIMGREHGPGQSALLHFAGDDGQRSALVATFRPAHAKNRCAFHKAAIN